MLLDRFVMFRPVQGSNQFQSDPTGRVCNSTHLKSPHLKSRLSLGVAKALAGVGLVGLLGGSGETQAVEIETTDASAMYELYGVISLQGAYRDYSQEDTTPPATPSTCYDSTTPCNTGWQLNNESRIGFRGSKQFENMASTFIWQVESGYVDESYKRPGEDGRLGFRDTFVGVQGDDFGKIRMGRVLTPLYELVDWPGSNPGLNSVYDWEYDVPVAYQDRQSNSIRYDSTDWSGFTASLAVGRGDNSSTDPVRPIIPGTRAANHGTGEDIFYGLAGHYKFEMMDSAFIQLDAAYEHNDTDTKGVTRDVEVTDTLTLSLTADSYKTNTWLVGLQGGGFMGFGFFAQYKQMNGKYEGTAASTAASAELKQNALSAGITYDWMDWQFKVGYAKNDKLKVEGGGAFDSTNQDVNNTEDTVYALQVLYHVDPSAVLYARYRDVDIDGEMKSGDFKEYSVGLEYYF